MAKPAEMQRSMFGKYESGLIVFTKGVCSLNPGPAAFAGAFYDLETGRLIREYSQMHPREQTNNEVEYAGVIQALSVARELHPGFLKVAINSSIVANQINEEFRVNEHNLEILLRQVKCAQQALLDLGTHEVQYGFAPKENRKIVHVTIQAWRCLRQHVPRT